MTPLTFRLSDDSSRAVRETLLSHGYIEYNPALHSSCDLVWTTKQCLTAPSSFSSSLPRLLNHLPRTSSITQKDCLARSMRRMRAVYGRVYNFTPITFILPRERIAWEAAFTLPSFLSSLSDECKQQITLTPATPPWILKPALSSQGRGISLVSTPSAACHRAPAVVQRYIADPHLVHGHKYDLRLYLLVTSVLPLRAWVCTAGLCRFASSPYNAGAVEIRGHLTNSSLADKASHVLGSSIPPTCKWTLAEYEAHVGGSVLPALMPQLLLTLVPLIADGARCEAGGRFELLGLDVMRDRGGHWWLLEVNKSPSLVVKGPQDEAVKPPMLRDMLRLLTPAEGTSHVRRRSKGHSRQGSMSEDEEAGKSVGCWQALWPTTPHEAALNSQVAALGTSTGLPTALPLSRYLQAVVDGAKARMTALTPHPSYNRVV